MPHCRLRFRINDIIWQLRDRISFGVGRTCAPWDPSISPWDEQKPIKSSCFPKDCSHGYRTNQSSTTKSPVPSPCYRKSKRREDIDLTTRL